MCLEAKYNKLKEESNVFILVFSCTLASDYIVHCIFKIKDLSRTIMSTATSSYLLKSDQLASFCQIN